MHGLCTGYCSILCTSRINAIMLIYCLMCPCWHAWFLCKVSAIVFALLMSYQGNNIAIYYCMTLQYLASLFLIGFLCICNHIPCITITSPSCIAPHIQAFTITVNPLASYFSNSPHILPCPHFVHVHFYDVEGVWLCGCDFLSRKFFW